MCFLGVNKVINYSHNFAFPSYKNIIIATKVSRIHFIITTRYSCYVCSFTMANSGISVAWKQKLYGDDIVFSASNGGHGVNEWDIYVTLSNINTDISVLPLWANGDGVTYSSVQTLPSDAITL